MCSRCNPCFGKEFLGQLYVLGLLFFVGITVYVERGNGLIVADDSITTQRHLQGSLSVDDIGEGLANFLIAKYSSFRCILAVVDFRVQI